MSTKGPSLVSFSVILPSRTKSVSEGTRMPLSHLPTSRGFPWPMRHMALATSSSSWPKSRGVAAAMSTSALAPTHMETLSSLPCSLAMLYMVNRWRGTSLTAMWLRSMIIILWKETFFFPSNSVTMTPDVM